MLVYQDHMFRFTPIQVRSITAHWVSFYECLLHMIIILTNSRCPLVKLVESLIAAAVRTQSQCDDNRTVDIHITFRSE